MALQQLISQDTRLRISISKEELSHLPAAVYTDGADIIDSPELVAQAVDSLRQAPILGFDTETRPSFRKGVSHKVSLLQLATPQRCFLFRINMLGLMPELIALLEDHDVLKVGISLKDDFHQLAPVGLKSPRGFIDLQNYVKQFAIADNSLSRIYAILFGKRIAKGQRLTNWEAAKLTEAQTNYAAFDAVACIHIYKYLAAGLFDPISSPYILSAV